MQILIMFFYQTPKRKDKSGNRGSYIKQLIMLDSFIYSMYSCISNKSPWFAKCFFDRTLWASVKHQAPESAKFITKWFEKISTVRFQSVWAPPNRVMMWDNSPGGDFELKDISIFEYLNRYIFHNWWSVKNWRTPFSILNIAVSILQEQHQSHVPNNARLPWFSGL